MEFFELQKLLGLLSDYFLSAKLPRIDLFSIKPFIGSSLHSIYMVQISESPSISDTLWEVCLDIICKHHRSILLLIDSIQ